jgi:hypothetical protein
MEFPGVLFGRFYRKEGVLTESEKKREGRTGEIINTVPDIELTDTIF